MGETLEDVSSTNLKNSTNDEQLKLFSQKQLRPVWHLRQDVEAHLVETKVFSEDLALK